MLKKITAASSKLPIILGVISCFVFGYFAVGFILHFLVYQNSAGVMVWGLREFNMEESIIGIPAVIGFFGAIAYLRSKRWGFYTVQCCLLWIAVFLLGRGIFFVRSEGDFFKAIAGIVMLIYGAGLLLFFLIVHFTRFIPHRTESGTDNTHSASRE